MNQEKIQQLTDLLKRLNADQITPALKQETKEFLTDLNPAELSLAEQKLIKVGLKPEDLRHLCATHIEMLKENLK